MKTRLLSRESAIYAAGAAAGFGVDICSLWLLVDRLAIHYLVAATLAFLLGTIVVYWVSVRHAFRYRRIEDRRSEFVVFTAIGVIGIGVNLVLMAALVELLGLHYLFAKVFAAAMSFFMNFGLRRWLLFSAPMPRRSSSPERL
jgi:putative flippase GtrA